MRLLLLSDEQLDLELAPARRRHLRAESPHARMGSRARHFVAAEKVAQQPTDHVGVLPSEQRRCRAIPRRDDAMRSHTDQGDGREVRGVRCRLLDVTPRATVSNPLHVSPLVSLPTIASASSTIRTVAAYQCERVFDQFAWQTEPDPRCAHLKRHCV